MSPLGEVALLSGRELRRSLRSGKGILLVNIAFLIGTAVALGIVKVQEMQRERMGPLSAEDLSRARELFYGQFVDKETAHLLMPAPVELSLLVWFLVFSCPLLVVLLGFDAVGGDLQHRTVRYFSSRARRVSYYVAKWLSLFTLVASVLLIIGSLGWTIIVTNDIAPLGTTVSWGIRLWLTTLPVVAAWTALGTLVGSVFRAPVLSLLTTFVAFFAIWLFGVAFAKYFSSEPLSYIYPGTFSFWLVSADPNRVVKGLLGTLGIAAAATGAGSFLFGKRDL